MHGSNHRLCLFSFGLSTHIKNILMIKQSILLSRFFKILKFLPLVSGSFPCSFFTWLPIIDIKSVSKNLSIRKLSIPVIITFRCYWISSWASKTAPMRLRSLQASKKFRHHCKMRWAVALDVLQRIVLVKF